MKLLALFLLFISGQLFSQEEEKKASQSNVLEKPYANDEAMTEEEEKKRDVLQQKLEEPRLSNKWFRGNYLIYDCDKGFFACVNNTSFEKCKYQRMKRKERREVGLACAPLKRFDTQKACFKVQYEKMHNQVPKLFCINPNYR
jgi:hypothetical protein